MTHTPRLDSWEMVTSITQELQEMGQVWSKFGSLLFCNSFIGIIHIHTAHLKCTSQWFSVYSQSCVAITTV